MLSNNQSINQSINQSNTYMIFVRDHMKT